MTLPSNFPSARTEIAYLRDALDALQHAVAEFMLNADYKVEEHYEEELVVARDDAVALLVPEEEL